MRIDTKFSVSLHILLLLAVFPDEKMTSEAIAQSTGSNPVVIRTLLGRLQKAGLVQVRRGTGGAILALPPEEITLLAVYAAVGRCPLPGLIGLHPSPSPFCPVGKNIHTLLEKPYNRVASAMQQAMQASTLAELVQDYKQLGAHPCPPNQNP